MDNQETNAISNAQINETRQIINEEGNKSPITGQTKIVMLWKGIN